MVDAYPHFIDASVLSSPKAAQLPEELFELILEHLCLRRQAVLWERSPFDRSLGDCSLTCRYWAAHIRPALFSKVDLTSQKDATTFAALVRSSIAVPVLLRVAVRAIELIAVEGSRPWIHHVWTLLRDGVLPNLQSIDLMIHGSRSLKVSHDGQGNRHRCEVLYAIGLPRTVPSARVFRLRTLMLRRLKFRSCAALVRCLTSLDAETIDCAGLQWPKEAAAPPGLAAIGHTYARMDSVMQKRVLVRSCTAISAFVWSLITAHLPPPGVARRLVYISPYQIATVMDILRLFSDECECSVCARAQRLDRDEDVVYWRENHLLQAHIDPTDRATACLSIAYARAHTLAMQIGPTGVVSRLRLETSHASIFPSSARNLHYDQSFAAPIVLEGTFTRLDRLCESLSDTLREVTISLDRPGATADHLTTTLRRLRDQMPNMARRHRLVFSVLTNDFPAASEDDMYSGAARDLFEGDGQYYSNVALEL